MPLSVSYAVLNQFMCNVRMLLGNTVPVVVMLEVCDTSTTQETYLPTLPPLTKKPGSKSPNGSLVPEPGSCSWQAGLSWSPVSKS